MGIPPTGRRVEIPGMSMAELREAKFVSDHFYFDALGVLRVCESAGFVASRCRVASVITCLPSPAAAKAGTNARVDADAKEIQQYRLTSATLTKLGQVQEDLYAALKADPELAKRYADSKEDSEDEPKTLDDMAKRFDRIPEMKQAIVKSGFTPRQYMLATMAMVQAAMSSAVMGIPGADKSQITPEVQANIAFMKAHKAEMDRMQARTKEIEKLSKPSEAHQLSGASISAAASSSIVPPASFSRPT